MYDPLIVDKFLEVHAEIAPRLSDQPLPRQRHQRLALIARGAATPQTPTSAGGLDDIAASTEETLVLYDLARSLTGHLDLVDAGNVIAQHIRRLVPASTCVFYLYDAGSDELFVAHAAGDNAAHFSGLRIARGQRLTGWVAANLQTIINSDPVLDLGEVARDMRPRPRSCLSTPLVNDGKLTGVLTLYSPDKDAFSDDHHRIVEVVSKQVSQTILRGIRNHDNRMTTLEEPRLGLPNLQHLRRFIAFELSSTGSGNPLSMIFIDFKQLSAVGRGSESDIAHRVANGVLEAIKQALRTDDILFRYGRDEFVVLLTDTDLETALTVASRISGSVSDLVLHLSGVEHKRSITIGVATAPADGITVEDLLSSARSRERIMLRRVLPPPSVH